MAKFKVGIFEYHREELTVEAESRAEAMKKAEELYIEYNQAAPDEVNSEWCEEVK